MSSFKIQPLHFIPGLFTTLLLLGSESTTAATASDPASPSAATEYWSGTFTVAKDASFVTLALSADTKNAAGQLRFAESGKEFPLSDISRSGNSSGRLTFSVKTDSRSLRFSLAHAGKGMTGEVTSGNDRGTANLVKIIAPDLARDARAVGAFRTSDGHTIGLTMMSDFPHLRYVDYTTGRFGALFAVDAVDKRTYQAGPANLVPTPAEITINLAADFASLKWNEKSRKTTAKRIAFTEQRTKFPSGTNTLGGTLILPPGAGPFPAVVLTQTSSDAPREAYTLEAYFFAARGVAAFIYDKRGVGESAGASTGTPARPDMHGLADDAIAAGDWLAAQPAIDATRIGVWGQSQGGWIAPLAGAKANRFAFVIAQAGSGVTPAQQEIFRIGNALRSAGLSAADVEAGDAYQKMLMHWVTANGEGKEELWARARAGKGTAWGEIVELVEGEPRTPRASTVAMFSYDPVPWAEKLRVPAFYLWGDRDSFVPVPESEKRIRAAVQKSGNTNVKFAVYPDTAHGWWQTKEDTGIAFTTQARQYGQNYFRDLGAWVDRVGGGK